MIGAGLSRAVQRPSGPYAAEMTGPGAWPEVEETVFEDRAQELGNTLGDLQGAIESWRQNQASLFNGNNVWSGGSSAEAGTAVEKHSGAMTAHEHQIRTAIKWCNDAASDIVGAKKVIIGNVHLAQAAIRQLENAAAKNGEDATAAVHTVVNNSYYENFNVINELAVGLGGKPGVPEAPFTEPDEVDGEEATPEQQSREERRNPARSRRRPGFPFRQRREQNLGAWLPRCACPRSGRERRSRRTRQHERRRP